MVRVGTAAKQSLEIQFKTKKKRLDMLKKELIVKQQPVLELYQALVELKKKLEQTGAQIHLDEMKFIDCEHSDPPSTGEQTKISSQVIESLRSLIEKLVTPVLDYCKNVMVQREDILQSLETNPEIIQSRINSLKLESEDMTKNFDAIRCEQERNITQMVNYIQTALEGSNVALEIPSQFADDSEVEQLRQLLREKEQKLLETVKLNQDLQDESRKKSAAMEELNKYKHHVADMKQKIKVQFD